jgi:hypothetical protein
MTIDDYLATNGYSATITVRIILKSWHIPITSALGRTTGWLPPIS